MSATRTVHRCIECGSSFPRWSGRCTQCGEWNSLVEQKTIADPAFSQHFGSAGLANQTARTPVALSSISNTAGKPVAVGIDALDGVLFGGLVPGSVTLIGGEPGIGKSTLLLQTAAAVSRQGTALLIAAEESSEQVSMRATRLGLAVDNVHVLSTTSVPEAIIAAERMAPNLCIIDSIQAISDPGSSGGPGSVTQVRECAARLVAFAKATGIPIVLVGHVTKDGSLAGPRVLEHLVDTVCSFEGDRHHCLRILSVIKHRFGPAGEVAMFTMTDKGLQGVEDPSKMLLSDRCSHIAGGIVVPVLEGRRPVLVELQALVASSSLPTPRRSVQGMSTSRLAVVMAVLERRLGYPLAPLDVFVSIVGGMKVSEPAADLAVGLALVSALTGQPIGDDVVACAEIGLGGELRQVSHTDRRLAEAARHGFSRAVVPVSAPNGPDSIELLRAASLREAVMLLGFPARNPTSTEPRFSANRPFPTTFKRTSISRPVPRRRHPLHGVEKGISN